MLENHGFLQKGLSVTVIPSATPFSMNIGKRFWAMDDTDINRMFPGYDKGKTTQRIAAGLFEKLQGYEYGIQKASFYMPGEFRFFPKNGGIHFYHNVQAFNVDSRSTLKA